MTAAAIITALILMTSASPAAIAAGLCILAVVAWQTGRHA